MLHISNLAYVNLESEVNKRIANASKIHSRGHLGAIKDEMVDWTIIKANDGGFFSAGFVIGYRGTEMKEGMETVYDMIADIDLFGLGTNAQDGHASVFAAGLILEHEQSDLYVTGHSLGGFLAQVVSYRILDQQLHNAFYLESSNHTNLKEILLQGSRFKKGVTFNAAPFFYNSYDSFIGNFTALRPAIPIDVLESSKYDNQVINYSIDGDFLQSWFVDTGSATKFGKIVPAFPMLNSGESSHALVQFYEHFPRYDGLEKELY